jgi:hypothetical protein
MKNLIIICIVTLLFFPRYIKAADLKISCNNAYLREKPNKASKDLALIKEGEIITYIKETKFSEIFKIQGKDLLKNWTYVKYKNLEGWVFSGCVEGLESIQKRIYTSDFDLVGRVFHHESGIGIANPDINIEKCEFTCECDCEVGTIEFIDKHTCIMYNSCCCHSPEDSFKGYYKIEKGQVICDFKAKFVSEYDEAVTNFKDDLIPINPKPIIKEGKAFTYRFKVDFCKDGLMYLFNDLKEDNIYAKINLNQKPRKVDDLLNRL